jgi:hypothetical protein
LPEPVLEAEPEVVKEVELTNCPILEIEGGLKVTLHPQAERQALATYAAGTPQVLLVERGELTRLSLPTGKASLDLYCGCPDSLQVMSGAEVQIPAAGCRLSSVRAYGASSVTISGTSSETLELRVSGGARLEVVQMDVDRLSLQLGGQSETMLHGVASSIDMDLAGSARLDAGKLRSQSAVVLLKGESWASVWVTAHLDQDIAESSQLEVIGDPQLANR